MQASTNYELNILLFARNRTRNARVVGERTDEFLVFKAIFNSASAQLVTLS